MSAGKTVSQGGVEQITMEARIQKVLKTVFASHNGDFSDSSGPEDIQEWDSMNHLNLVMELGNEFGVNLGFEEMLEIQKVGDIKTILKRHNVN